MKKIIFFTAISLLIIACGVFNKKNKGKGVNLFTVEQDKQLGAQVAGEIDGNPKQYPILDSAKNVEVYKLIYRVRDAILNSGEVDFKDDFSWRLRIINDDKTNFL